MLNSKLNVVLGLTLLFAGASPLFGQNPTPLLQQPLDKLIEVLKSDATQKEKIDACRQLAVIGTKEAVAPLAALLGDETLSHMARYGLEPIPDPAVDEALRKALGELKGRPLVGVIASLGVRRDAQAVPLLAKLLQSYNADVVQAAAGSLGKIGTSAASKALLEAWANTPAPRHLGLAEGLFRCAEALAAKGLRNDALAIYDLLRGAQAPHQVRAGALRGAILTRGKDGPPILREALRSDDFVLVDAAARTAMEMPGTEVTSQLIGALNETSSADKKMLLLQTLGKRGDPAALPQLVQETAGRPKAVRLAAIRAWAEIGMASQVTALVKLMEDADSDIAQAAQESLASLPGQEVDAAVVKLLSGGETSQRLTAIELIGRRRMTACVPALLEAAEDTDAKVRPAAIKKLGELGTPAEVPAFLDLLARAKRPQDLDALVQALGAVCVRANDPEGCAEKLTSRLAQAQPGPKGALLRVLSIVGGAEALKAVRAAVEDANPEVHAAAIRALGTWKTADAAPLLLALAQAADNPTDKMLCLRSYLDWAANADLPVDQRLSMCQQAAGLIQRTEEKKLLLSALGGITTPESLAQIAPYLEDAATRDEASAATVAIAEKLLQGRNAAKFAPRLIAPLEKAAQATANEDLARRAKALLQQAQSKTGAR